MRSWLATLSFGAISWSSAAAQTRDTLHIAPLAATDIAAAMTAPAALRFEYTGTGTAASDTTVRMAELGVADLEGGDGRRGLRLVAAALARGMTDSLFFTQASVYACAHRRPDLAVALLQQATRQWPRNPRWWHALATSLEGAGQPALADSARARAAALEHGGSGR